MKTCSLIYNPVSRNFNYQKLNIVTTAIENAGYFLTLSTGQYPGYITEIIKEVNDYSDLIITMGGDGTISEAYEGFNQVEQRGLYSHVPTGTTNDFAHNLNIPKNHPHQSITAILNGSEQNIDLLTVNHQGFAYVSAFGHLTDVTYKTNHTAKQIFGYYAYLYTFLKDMLPLPEPMTISYTKDNKEYIIPCVFGAITNAKQFAGVKIHSNVDLNDGLFEVLILKEANHKLALTLVSDILKGQINLNKYTNHIEMLKTNYIDLTFIDGIPKEYTNDGEQKFMTSNNLEYQTSGKVKMLLPKK